MRLLTLCKTHFVELLEREKELEKLRCEKGNIYIYITIYTYI